MKTNALGMFACNIRREIGNCEKFNSCESKWDFDKKTSCSIDPNRLCKTTLIDIISLINDRVSSLPVCDDCTAEIDEIFGLLDYLEGSLAKIVGQVGIGQQNSWPANVKAG